ncbi:MAG TPA: hypothetical protein VFX59_00170 [Polyangiales bacterium]|nr:hypothetical protein [Polyangiales bacterium]
MRNLLVISGLLLALGACSPTLAPVYSPAQTAGVSAAGTPYTAAQIDAAAIAGAQAKGWTVISHAPGLTVAEVASGGHQARVRILTNDSGWRIVHEQSSPGLKFATDERHGEIIHRRYNHWVRLLDDAIRQHLALAPAPVETAPVAAPAI